MSFSDLLAAAEDDSRSRPSTESSEPAVRRHRGGRYRYRLAASKQMVGILLCVWVRADLLPCVAGVRASCVGRGVMGYMGNKGSVSVSLSLRGGASLCFMCTHLASGRRQGRRRRAAQRRRGRDPEAHEVRAAALAVQSGDAGDDSRWGWVIHGANRG